MDTTDSRTLRIVAEPASPALVTPAELREQFSRDDGAIIRCAAQDVAGDLAAMDGQLADLPPELQRRLVRARCFWRALTLDGNPGADAAGADYQRLLDSVDLHLAFNQQPAPKRRKSRADA